MTSVGCGLLLAACGSVSPPSSERAATSSSSPSPAAPATATATATATETETETETGRAQHPRPGRVGDVVGEWEDGELLGEPLEVGFPGAETVYAARRDGLTYVATGVRDGDRTLRTIQALTPETEEAADGMDLYGGYVVGERGPDDRVADGSYLIVGSVPGDVEVALVRPDGSSRPVTRSSADTLPGYTVFYDTGDWEQGWDQLQAAPLTVTTGDGHRVAVRERSWTG